MCVCASHNQKKDLVECQANTTSYPADTSCAVKSQIFVWCPFSYILLETGSYEL